jgi:CDP-glycerol glycerophosphotransferase (TagB/SpsB family)
MKRKILFVSQDQGSGNALYLVIKKLHKEKNLSVRVFAAKQSKDIFKDQGISFLDIDNKNFSQSLDFNPDLIITGTSMRHCIEKEAILYGRKHRIKTISLLDFLSHYWERFTSDGKKDISLLPDYIFVLDDIAKNQMISEGFPEKRLIVTGNPYFDTFMINNNKARNLKTDSMLYISQPIYQNGFYKTDFSIFEDLLNVIQKVDKKIKIIIRPHPKDSFEAYTKYAGDNIIIDEKTDTINLMKRIDIVIGKNSTVLFEAVFRGKIVISYQPKLEKLDRLVTNQLGLSYVVHKKSDLAKIIDKAAEKKLKTKKIGVIKFYNDGKCTERVVKNIRHIL